MKHLRVSHTPEDIARINGGKRSSRVILSSKLEYGKPACLSQLEDGDELVDAALSAECDACRVAVGVAKTGDKTWETDKPVGVHPAPTWEAAPMAGAEDLIANAMKNRG